MENHIPRHAASGHQQVVYVQRHHAPLEHLEIALGLRQNQDALITDELRENAKAVDKPTGPASTNGRSQRVNMR
jgi:hypothetical protein